MTSNAAHSPYRSNKTRGNPAMSNWSHSGKTVHQPPIAIAPKKEASNPLRRMLFTSTLMTQFFISHKYKNMHGSLIQKPAGCN
jgi:hypothetical protein